MEDNLGIVRLPRFKEGYTINARVSALLYGAMVANPYLAIVGLSLAVGFEEFTQGSFWAATINVAGAHAGSATGMLNTMGNLGGVASTALVPILVEKFGWAVALGSGSVLAVLGSLLWLGIDSGNDRDG